MDVSTIESMANSVIDPIKTAVPNVAGIAFGLLGIVLTIGIVFTLVKKFTKKGSNA